MTEIDWKTWETSGDDGRRADVDAMNATNHADQYVGSYGNMAAIPGDQNLVWASIPMLHFLWGRPWNNMALNYVMALRPTLIRVTAGSVTTDAYTWRVTVHLEKDERTIKKVVQEVQAMGVGCRYGADLKLHQGAFKDKLEQKDFPPTPSSLVNLKAAKKLDLTGRYPCDRPLVSNPPDVEEF